MEKQNNQYFLLSSVKNALRILQSFSLDEPQKKVTDLAKSLGIDKSTASRLLSTLASEGFVTKDPETRKYRPGLSILYLNTIITSNLEVKKESIDVLQKLVNDIQETSFITVLDDSNIIYLNRMECKHPDKILSQIGVRNPAHCTSAGRVILAYQNEEATDRIIENGLQKYTPKTVVDSDDLRTILKKTKEQGYAICFDQIREGFASIAAPIRDYNGNIINAITIIAPVYRITNSNSSYYVNKMISAAKEISTRLGYWKKY